MSEREAIELRKGVPVPERKGGPGRHDVYPWQTMSIGDSFLFPVGYRRTSAGRAASVAGQRLGRKFVTHSINDGHGAGRIGCWRVE